MQLSQDVEVNVPDNPDDLIQEEVTVKKDLMDALVLAPEASPSVMNVVVNATITEDGPLINVLHPDQERQPHGLIPMMILMPLKMH